MERIVLKEIGDRVRQARTKKNMSQAQLARALHVSAPFVSNIEQGKQTMNIVTLCDICEVLDVSADWILRDRTPESRRITDEEIAKVLADCTPVEKSAMLKLMHSIKEVLRNAKA